MDTLTGVFRQWMKNLQRSSSPDPHLSTDSHRSECIMWSWSCLECIDSRRVELLKLVLCLGRFQMHDKLRKKQKERNGGRGYSNITIILSCSSSIHHAFWIHVEYHKNKWLSLNEVTKSLREEQSLRASETILATESLAATKHCCAFLKDVWEASCSQQDSWILSLEVSWQWFPSVLYTLCKYHWWQHLSVAWSPNAIVREPHSLAVVWTIRLSNGNWSGNRKCLWKGSLVSNVGRGEYKLKARMT